MFALHAATPLTSTRAGVGLIIRDRRGRILLEQRSDCGLWGLPGGRIEPGESITETAKREAREETGLAIRVTGLQGVYTEPADRIITYPDNGDQRHLIDIAVTAVVVSGRLRISSESLELRWCSRRDTPWDEVCPAAVVPLHDAFSRRLGIVG